MRSRTGLSTLSPTEQTTPSETDRATPPALLIQGTTGGLFSVA
jgi:hypothetical protein